jgi:hypothetical protein
VKGTLVGAAIGAAIATTVASLISQSAARAQSVWRPAVDPRPPTGGRPPSGRPGSSRPGPTPRRVTSARSGPTGGTDRTVTDRRWHLWLVATASALGAFVLALGLVTVVELSAGRSLSSIFGGPMSGTTVGGVFDGVSPSTTVAPTTTTTTSTTTTTTTVPATTTSTVPATTTTIPATTTTVPGISTGNS